MAEATILQDTFQKRLIIASKMVEAAFHVPGASSQARTAGRYAVSNAQYRKDYSQDVTEATTVTCKDGVSVDNLGYSEVAIPPDVCEVWTLLITSSLNLHRSLWTNWAHTEDLRTYMQKMVVLPDDSYHEFPKMWGDDVELTPSEQEKAREQVLRVPDSIASDGGHDAALAKALHSLMALAEKHMPLAARAVVDVTHRHAPTLFVTGTHVVPHMD